MGIGKIDPEYAVREGWSRDSDDEIYMDGYNAFIQITTHDGTSGFSVKNDIGAIAFSSGSDGDGYVAKDLSVGEKTTTSRLQVSEDAVTNYVLTSDSQGNATWQPAGEDVKVKVSLNDSTAGYLVDKLQGGKNISFDELNDGGNESLEIKIDDNYLDGYLDDNTHRDLDQLVHEISEDSFEEMTYLNNNITNIIVWTDSGKTKKIREQQFVYGNGNRISQATTIQYDEYGIEAEREVEDFTFTNNKITSITRNLTLS